jgi:secondary thiamine-phosphate synthase enzyme
MPLAQAFVPLDRLNCTLHLAGISKVIEHLHITVSGQGLHAFTAQVRNVVTRSGQREGLCSLFIRHTSASLLIQENYDDSARLDLENWLNRLVPENDSLYTHTLEGPDDMPAHIKSALTATQLSIPFAAGELLLGTWQGIYLWEHRHAPCRREVIVHL